MFRNPRAPDPALTTQTPEGGSGERGERRNCTNSMQEPTDRQTLTANQGCPTIGGKTALGRRSKFSFRTRHRPDFEFGCKLCCEFCFPLLSGVTPRGAWPLFHLKEDLSVKDFANNEVSATICTSFGDDVHWAYHRGSKKGIRKPVHSYNSQSRSGK